MIAYKDGKKVSVVEQAGTGRRQQLVQAIWEWENREVMRPNAADSVVIAYDEPDVSLDYERQRNFMSVIRQQCATSNARAIVATSPQSGGSRKPGLLSSPATATPRC